MTIDRGIMFNEEIYEISVDQFPLYVVIPLGILIASIFIFVVMELYRKW